MSLRALAQAFDACRRGKQNAPETQAYSAHLLDHLLATRDALNAGTWCPSPSWAFVCTHPKRREIHAAPFADRVVHHWLVEHWAALIEPCFIHDSYANRRGKGTHAAVTRLQTFLRRAAADLRRQSGAAGLLHVLKLDVADFFHSIDRRCLAVSLRKHLRRGVARGAVAQEQARMLWRCTLALLRDDPAARSRWLGPPALRASVPPHKRLGGQGPGVGLAIGNLTSQFFGNVVLDELDQFVKRSLGARFYLRYVDDFLLLASDPATLLDWRARIADFLHQRWGLRLRRPEAPRPVREGIDWLGFIVRPAYRLVRRRIVRRAWSWLAAFGRRWRPRADAWAIPPQALAALQARLASWLGHFRHADSGRLWQRLCRRFQWLHGLFTRLDDALERGLQPRWRLPRPGAARSLRQQVDSFSTRCRVKTWLVQVGNRWWLIQAGQGRPQCEMSTAASRAQARAWREAGQPFGVLVQTDWQRDGRRQRQVARLHAAAPQAFHHTSHALPDIPPSRSEP